VDYTVDYTFGKVTILNDGILSSGKDINVTYEQQDPFAFQTRSLLGSRFDYKINDDFNAGATFLYYNERPLISRNLIGSEPARNVQYGFDLNYRKDSRVLTKMVDALPFLQTKETSSISLSTEFAQLIPGTSNIVDGEGTSFIDDFENTATPYSLQTVSSWKLASIPKDIRFDPSDGAPNDITAGFKRAKLAWYQIDNLWYREGTNYKPEYLSTEVIDGNHYTRKVFPQEIFPGRDQVVGNFNEPIFDLAYYPSERGPYNYSTDLNPADGALRNPKDMWGGITTAIKNEVDFDKSNIEYIEFWMMDPFLNVVSDQRNPAPNNKTGGKLIFHLGNISEDVARDNKHGFENGLPKDGDLTSANVTSTNWGYVTTQQYLNNAFENEPATRPNQDVGMDGLGNENEATFFKNEFLDALSVDAAVKAEIESDPSADDFKYFLGGEFDNAGRQVGLLERYKNFNGMENNSPISRSTDLFPRSNYTVPDNEDLNVDNTLSSDKEEYYSYSVDLLPGQLAVGKKYIVDAITPKEIPDVTWYLFRIPVRQFEEKVGDINGFKSIRYIRTILTGFEEPVVLRMANFRAVGNRWRRYTGTLEDSRFGEPLEPNLDNFSVSAVNIEDNGSSTPLKPPYVEPLRRDRDNTSTIPRRLNEQSVQLCVNDLQDGDGRAIYKNVGFDFFNYGRIQMFISAYGQNVESGDLTAFLRLGTDFDQNYYEVELPLQIVDPTDADVQNAKTSAIWPELNRIDLDLDDLYALKVQRDRESFSLGTLYPQSGPRLVDDRQGIRILGRPDLSQVKVMMIGVRNKTTTDKRAFTICMWANELRLTDFDRTAGWALNAVASAKLADLGTVNGSYKHISFGYGGVQSKIYERARGETNAYDISTNLNLDKLLPKWTGLKIPVYASYERSVINPKYDPANPDTRLEAAMKSFTSDSEKAEFLKVIQDVSIRRSLNFTNVKRVKLDPKAKQHIYDIENFSFTYAFSEATRTNFNLQENTQRNYRGGAAWQYASKFKGFEPFKEAKWTKPKALQLIRDINFNPMPTSISIRGDLDRSFNKIVYRNASAEASSSLPNYQKYFVFNRNYNVKWALAKSLSLDYNSRAIAIIDEPDGDLDNDSLRQIVKDNLKKLGRTKNFEQNVTLNYTLPFDKIPVINWMGADYRYNVGYSWRAGPLEKADSLKLGNIIQNNTDIALTGKVDFLKLYNKVKFLRDINTPKRPLTAQEKAREAKAKPKPDTVRKPPNLYAVKGLLRTLMAIRNINGTYNLTQGTIMPGFNPEPKYVGMDADFNAPGWGFVFGSQDPNIRFKARDNGWLTTNSKLTSPFTQLRNKDLSVKANLEPAAELKVQLDMKKTSMSSYQEIFRFDSDSGRYVSLSPSMSGSYKVSILTINTAFNFKNNASINSSAFKQFEKNIGLMQERFNAITGSTYEGKSQDVLIPAFLAAYTGKDATSASLSPFPNIPLPNWRLDYNGLSKIEALKNIFQSVTLTHAYSSTYSVMNFTNSLEYKAIGLDVPLEDYNRMNFATVTNAQGKIIPIYVISQVMISELFQPLIGISVRTQGKMTVRLDYKTKRDLALNISNSQVTELSSRDISGEVGFTKNNLKLPWRDKGRIITIKNDVTFKMNVSYTNNQTIQRKIEDVNTITNGNINFQLRPNISYVANQKLTTQFYYEYNFNEPLVSSSFKRSTTRVGLRVLFNLAQ
jgi:cell surface protein SprA